MADIQEIIRKLRPDAAPSPSLDKVDVWLSWWRGKVDKFHNYRLFNGQTYLDCERKSLGMAKKVCEDWANLLMNEKCKITIPEKDDELQNILNYNLFWIKANGGIEKAFALGYGAFVETVTGIEVGDQGTVRATDKSRVKIDFINRKRMYPITVEDRTVKECGFESKNSNGVVYVLHLFNKTTGFYEIYSYTYDTHGAMISQTVFNTQSANPWFQVVRPNVESNVLADYSDNEIGMSIFANSIDTLKAVDNAYDGFDNEIVLARRRIFVQQDLLQIDYTTGKQVVEFDPMEQAFYTTPKTKDGDGKIQSVADAIRHESHIATINTQLMYLSSKCGLGENYYRFDPKSAQATATQVISESSSMYHCVRKHEIVLESALRQLVRAVIDASNKFTTSPLGEIKDEDIFIGFNDSIFEDTETEQRRDRENVNAGVMSKVEFRMKWLGEDEETAKDKVASEPQNWVSMADKGYIPPYLALAKVLNITDEAALVMYNEELERKKTLIAAYEPSDDPGPGGGE